MPCGHNESSIRLSYTPPLLLRGEAHVSAPVCYRGPSPPARTAFPLHILHTRLAYCCCSSSCTHYQTVFPNRARSAGTCTVIYLVIRGSQEGIPNASISAGTGTTRSGRYFPLAHAGTIERTSAGTGTINIMRGEGIPKPQLVPVPALCGVAGICCWHMPAP